jgi:sec-independent protein translocase protein TatC
MKQDKIIAQYLPYLKEAQTKLLRIIIVFIAGGALGFIYYQPIIRTVMRLFALEGVNLVLTSPYQFIDLAISTGLLTGLTLALPLFGFYLLSFIRPALKIKEYRLLVKLYPVSLVLFFLGFIFGAWIIQLVIGIYTQVSADFSVQNLWDLGSFLNHILATGILMSLVFQLPIILTGLLQLKLISVSTLKRSRRYVYLAIMVLVALLPPNDIVSLIILTIPPLLLFELTLVFNQAYV